MTQSFMAQSHRPRLILIPRLIRCIPCTISKNIFIQYHSRHCNQSQSQWEWAVILIEAKENAKLVWYLLKPFKFNWDKSKDHYKEKQSRKPSRSGQVVYSAVLRATQMVVGLSPKPPPMLMDTSASMWIEKAQLPCWPLYSQQVSHQRWIWGSLKWESTQGIHPGFETQGRHHQKSKTGVSVAPRKGQRK